MTIQLFKGDIREVEADVLMVGCLEEEGCRGGAIADVNEVLGGEIQDILEAREFEGKRQTTCVVRVRGRMKARHVVVVGLGKKADLDVERARQAVGLGVVTAQKLKATSVATVLFGAGQGALPVRETAQAVAEALHLASYTFDTWKKKATSDTKLAKAVIVEKMQGKMLRAEAGMQLGTLMAEGALQARELVNEPAQEMTPRHLKAVAERLAKLSKNITVQIFGREEARRMGMHAFLAVAQGSQHEPFFIHLRYAPKKPYDSGGLSLKPSDSMKTMKMDMAGAAAVLGCFSVIDSVAPSIEVHGIIAACENMPSGTSYRPGDIVRAKNGLSIEIENTDAEGRVTLADALAYAVELKPSAIIDMATLTGACIVALGEEIVGVMSNNDALAEKIFAAAGESGEEVWELPLFEGYDKLIDSQVADVKNLGNKWGGALTAGLFLKRFVNGVPWVHL
ncbi:leucyl aminopeptidase, partial [Candidatus Uhrbacteria bacterium]|nr:leucyl aminopeptidase [Candidatus Uhrbacteria bacterium]